MWPAANCSFQLSAVVEALLQVLQADINNTSPCWPQKSSPRHPAQHRGPYMRGAFQMRGWNALRLLRCALQWCGHPAYNLRPTTDPTAVRNGGCLPVAQSVFKRCWPYLLLQAAPNAAGATSVAAGAGARPQILGGTEVRLLLSACYILAFILQACRWLSALATDQGLPANHFACARACRVLLRT